MNDRCQLGWMSHSLFVGLACLGIAPIWMGEIANAGEILSPDGQSSFTGVVKQVELSLLGLAQGSEQPTQPPTDQTAFPPIPAQPTNLLTPKPRQPTQLRAEQTNLEPDSVEKVSIEKVSIEEISVEKVSAEPANADNALAVVTSVSQLSDVQPTDWAFQALQTLVEKHGCMAGYPDGMFRGTRAVNRYEFAAGLNACIDRINQFIAVGTTDFISKEDLALLDKLQTQFASDLATLRGRVDALEGRVDLLEKQLFSPTTQLAGEAIFAVSDTFGGNGITAFPVNSAPTVNADTTNTVFQYRLRLDLTTSFSGVDRLTTRLQASNAIPPLTSGSAQPAVFLFANEGRFAHDLTTTNLTNGSVYLDLLSYRFPIGTQGQVTIFANAGSHYHYADTLNPYLDRQDGGNGALSRFAQRNPIYNLNGNTGSAVPGGAGIGVNYKLGNSFKLDFGYLASAANNPGIGQGLFNGNYSALGQLVYQGGDRFKLGFTYVNAYNAPGAFRFGGAGNAVGTFAGNLLGLPDGNNRAVSSNSYGVEASFQVNPKFVISGWAGFTTARLINFGDAEIWTYAIAFTFPDLVKPGSLGGIIVGMEPTLKGLWTSTGAVSLQNRSDAYHIEAFYKYQLTDYLSITPGLIWLPSVNQRADNSDIFIGTIRTTFTF